MTRVFKPICLITVLALVLALGAAIVPIGYTQASGDTYYVDASVAGPGTGTSGDPWKTITMALGTVPGDPADPDTIIVAAGTYDAANGETFPLTFANDGVVLVGAGETVTFIDGGSAATILDVNAGVIVIDGFTITNSTSDADYGIEASGSSGNLEVTGNIFTNVDYGVYLDIDEDGSNLGSDYTIADVLVNGNTFSFNDTGVEIGIELDFDDTVTGLSCDIGNIEVSENDFDSGDYGIYFWGYVEDLTDSTATIGDLLFNDNTFTGISWESIYVYPWESWYLEGTTTVTCGDLEINRNTTDGGYGFYVYWEYIGYDVYDTASVTVGDAFINNNEITSDGSYGIYSYYYENGYNLNDDASVTLGELHIEGNTIDSYYDAIYFEFCEFPYYMYLNSSFTMGDIYVRDNTVTSTDYSGLYIYYYDYYVASYMEDDSYARLPDWIITGNSFETYDDCIYFYTYSNPDENEDNATVDFSGFLIDDNTFYSSDYCGIYMEIDDLCETTYGSSMTTMGDITITNNTFTEVYDASIYIELDELGYDIYDSASLIFGDVTITGNTITDSGEEGIYLYYEYGGDTYDTSTVSVGDVVISENDISGTGDEAILVEYDCDSWGIYDTSTQIYGDVTIADNVIDDCPDGILVLYFLDVEGNSGETLTLGELDIIGNEVSNITSDDGIDLDYGLYVFDDVTLNVGRALIQDNTVSNCSSAALDFDMYIYAESTATVNLGDPEIIGNTLEDSEDGMYLWGVQNAEVTENDILNNEGIENGYCGIYIEDSYDWYYEESYPEFPAQGNVFRCNNFEGNEPYGLENAGTGEADAELNWWGDDSGPDGSGPGSGDAVSSNVDYEPWLVAPCGEEEVVAGFTVTPPTGQAPLTVQFYDTSTGAATWFWEFGDGGVSEAQYPTHTYQNEGVFSVRLTIEGVGGDTDETDGEVIVEAAAGAPNLVVRNLYISATEAQPRQKIVITADVFNEGGAWGDGDMDLIINGHYEQTAGVGVAPGTSQPISFTIYKVEAGEYQVVIGNAVGTFYVVEEPQPSRIGGIPMDSGTLIALIVIGVFVIAALVIAIVVFRPS
jgi:PKD repeat protein